LCASAIAFAREKTAPACLQLIGSALDQKRDFSAEEIRIAKDWISDTTVLVAEYWKVITTERDLVRGKKRRKVQQKTVCQYMTNGLAILDEIEHPGVEIPIPRDRPGTLPR
jgi:hypothetical protein